uniref:NADH dehydrogenase subunit 3 n=1 Tax=Heterophrynus longicornis TaxID=1046789 RepID=UPI0024116E12|nr:NADH dehydrogenase subunit 3 [Heterophrynus longicornis]WEM34676.1 NADH dehydrogenase subunit 3 [Heterophrynus longicornis]
MMSSIMILISSILMFSIFVILNMSKKALINQESSSPFECGFDPVSHPRIPFSIQFFLIAILFLIFDVEISLILPIPFFSSKSLHPMWSFSLFLLILLLGLIHEWQMGSLEWAN